MTNHCRGSSSFADDTWNACACDRCGQTSSGSPSRSTVRSSMSGSRAKRASIDGSYHWLNRHHQLALGIHLNLLQNWITRPLRLHAGGRAVRSNRTSRVSWTVNESPADRLRLSPAPAVAARTRAWRLPEGVASRCSFSQHLARASRRAPAGRPRVDDESLHAGLGEGRHVGHKAERAARRNREFSEPARLQVRQHRRRQWRTTGPTWPPSRSCHGRRGTLVRDVDHVRAGELAKRLRRKVRRTADRPA